MTKLHLKAIVRDASKHLAGPFRPIPRAWHEKYSDEFLGLASDLLGHCDYGLVLWKIEHEHPTIWEHRFDRPPVPKPQHVKPKPTFVQPSLFSVEDLADLTYPDKQRPKRGR